MISLVTVNPTKMTTPEKGGKKYYYPYEFDEIDVDAIKKNIDDLVIFLYRENFDNVIFSIGDFIEWRYCDSDGTYLSFFLDEDNIYVSKEQYNPSSKWRAYIVMSILDSFGVVSNFREKP